MAGTPTGQRRALSRFVKWVLVLVFPTLPITIYKNAKKLPVDTSDATFNRLRSEWEGELGQGNEGRREAVSVIYQSDIDRIVGLESKAVGLLSAVGIVAAGAFVCVIGKPPASFVAFVALAYALLSGAACCWLLVPEQRAALFLRDVKSQTNGFAEMAAVSAMLTGTIVRKSNLVASAALDLRRAAIAVVVSLLFLVVPITGTGIDPGMTHRSGCQTPTSIGGGRTPQCPSPDNKPKS